MILSLFLSRASGRHILLLLLLLWAHCAHRQTKRIHSGLPPLSSNGNGNGEGRQQGATATTTMVPFLFFFLFFLQFLVYHFPLPSLSLTGQMLYYCAEEHLQVNTSVHVSLSD